jgi:hypothetical protein
MKFFVLVEIPDAILSARYVYDRFKGCGMAGGGGEVLAIAVCSAVRP